jgi:hypothetical protein
MRRADYRHHSRIAIDVAEDRERFQKLLQEHWSEAAAKPHGAHRRSQRTAFG